jgi:hypothetical protein
LWSYKTVQCALDARGIEELFAQRCSLLLEEITSLTHQSVECIAHGLYNDGQEFTFQTNILWKEGSAICIDTLFVALAKNATEKVANHNQSRDTKLMFWPALSGIDSSDRMMDKT